MRILSITCLSMVLIGAVASALAGATEPLGVGDVVPDAQIQTLDGENTGLKEALGGKPTVLIFYRGGWCPYCNRHLSALAKAEPALKDLGFQIVGISPDGPEELKKTVAKQDLGYALLSDIGLPAAKAFGLAKDADKVPIPSAFLIDASGNITFAHVDPNYRKRIDSDVLLNAARGTR